MDKNTKAYYIKLVKFLADTLGRNYEIVLHDVSEDGANIAEIANNHISKRTINSPLTGIAMEMIKNKTYLERDYITHYKTSDENSKSMSGSTFFIKKDEKLEGLLCINHDTTAFKKISDEILSLACIYDNPNDEVENKEYIKLNLEELIKDITGMSIENFKNKNLKPKEKQKIIASFYEKGVFNVKGIIPKVAEILNISEPSVYRHLQKIK
ncbi:PAS domain-containing protein [Campylobacter insulaenigrae]|uniref:helix-turn-helix transcriptional regulator n=1 Tax=Campylobacter insulaenigrae TaxID=260714 RepID=UPI0021536EB2|nr:PAS domain-containing protein [Campylobacter insulaenigrae]MCR6571325.1 PAS domain-containing protein [Campylobacter insulaenigrae]MCR6572668.1 PAS domain-containing protein [Campylobacter insulaenigrae]MCR6574052.1 PAS domain-containing protein [Campylobacter insulaenigrae]MCR6575393.1 PAS domain-containing protein [Campylobacter insulaenigrae]MCR6577127.1 PAS domain-containing protein [Campylobacter insulaenigrae]